MNLSYKSHLMLVKMMIVYFILGIFTFHTWPLTFYLFTFSV